MLVIGARGLGGFAGLLLGSVSQQCVEHSPCPVVVLRENHDADDGPIVIGLDGSDGAAHALRWATELAAAIGSSIVAVHAPSIGANSTERNAAGEALERWCEPIRQRGIDVEMRVEAGDARTVLDQAAKSAGASLLVTGTRGLGVVHGVLLGSVAGYIARYSERPIAVIPRPGR